MAKSPDAFRTISEVAEWLDRPAHVLRFWESKFPQVKPVKRAGGRRYYRPQDMLLLGGIKQLLHDDGLTIKGVQKILREQGVAHVSELSQPLDDISAAQLGEALRAAEDDSKPAAFPAPPTPAAQDEAPMSVDLEPDSGTVLAFNRGAEPDPAPDDAPMDLFSHGGAELPDTPSATRDSDPVADDLPPAPVAQPSQPDATAGEFTDEPALDEDASDLPDFITESAFDTAPEPVAPELTDSAPETPMPPVAEAIPDAPAPEPVAPTFYDSTLKQAEEQPSAAPETAEQRDMSDADADTFAADADIAQPQTAEPAIEVAETPEQPATPAPSIMAPDLPDPPADDQIDAEPGLLTVIARAVQNGAPPSDMASVAPLLTRLAALSSRMQDARKH